VAASLVFLDLPWRVILGLDRMSFVPFLVVIFAIGLRADGPIISPIDHFQVVGVGGEVPDNVRDQGVGFDLTAREHVYRTAVSLRPSMYGEVGGG
jgi:hypothetical protein